jgi:hypothetical protein
VTTLGQSRFFHPQAVENIRIASTVSAEIYALARRSGARLRERASMTETRRVTGRFLAEA